MSIRIVSTAKSGIPFARSIDLAHERPGQARHDAVEQRGHRPVGQRLEVEGAEVALAGAPGRASFDELRAGQGDDQDPVVPTPLEDRLDEVDQPVVGPLEVLEHEDGQPLLGDPLDQPAGSAERLSEVDLARGAETEQGQQPGLHRPPLRLVRHVGLECGDQLGPADVGVVELGDPGPPADHLGQGPERDALAVGRRPALVPVDVAGQPVDVLEELPGEPCLADPGDAGDRHEARPALLVGRVEEILEQTQLAVPTHERWLEPVAPTAAADHRLRSQRPPGRDRRLAAAEVLVADGLGCDARGGRPVARLVDQDGPAVGDPLEPGCGVDEVARDKALVGRPGRDRGLAGHDGGAGSERRAVRIDAQRGDGAHELERSPDGPLGVVLERPGRAPHGHHRIPDELLERAAVAVDHGPARREVAVLELADLLCIATLGKGGEAHEVGEQHGHDPALGDGSVGTVRPRRASRCGGGRRPDRTERGPALAAELGVGLVGRAAVRTARGQPRSALVAELAPRLVLGRAARAAHQTHPSR